MKILFNNESILLDGEYSTVEALKARLQDKTGVNPEYQEVGF
jgi:hypothetical protein